MTQIKPRAIQDCVDFLSKIRIFPKWLRLFCGCLILALPSQAQSHANKPGEGVSQTGRVPVSDPINSITREIAAVQKRAKEGPLPAVPMPLNAQMVTFTFDNDYDYPILTRPWTMVHLEFGRDEIIQGLYLSDNTGRWEKKVAKEGRNFFIMPKADNLLNSGVITTNLRTYHFTITSSMDGPYYKRVAWTSDTSSIEVDLQNAGGPSPVLLQVGDKRRVNSNHTPARTPDFGTGDSVDMARANFDYTIKGNAPFKPDMVFDDGKFTWIQIPAGTQEIPAVFALAADGTAELVNFTTRRNYFVVQRLFPDGALLKLGKQEVKIYNRRGKSCGFFGCSTSVKNFQRLDD